ncbi:pancreatic triacylglycerol lipase-like [Polistes fuscatus]|uniref:pancreatic triacylglycerol lipase-like n=1 Tax=Polistes fuscatus TaxID=30207 RepID=UPI001CA8F1C3|nr:pancreatic triacylglycerol lipase-like [Polistes fuscatus]
MFLLNLPIEAIIFVLCCNLVISKQWESGLRERYDGYGEDWIFMPDGNGLPQVAILKYEDNARNILDNKNISYILYTRFGPENGTKLMINDTAGLLNSDFKASRKTKFITHGWKSSSMSSGFIDMKEAYLQHDDYNIILVDWEPLAASTFYLGPMQNTVRVGKDAANFIDFLVSETDLKAEDVHFLGHSLGAHVAGNVGSAITSGKLGRITGFDPALPGFHLFASDKTRLDLTDATFVDVIHSCGGILGYLQPVGKVDFYPNAGTAVQPGCCCVPEVMEACSHGRSYIYFTESINSKTGLPAVKCENWDRFVSGDCIDSEAVLMGEHVDKSASGSYFLRTRSESPYAYMPEVTSNDI